MWNLLPFENLHEFPALKWKVLNIQKMDVNKRASQQAQLQKVLDV